jgi:hypothetical protein
MKQLLGQHLYSQTVFKQFIISQLQILVIFSSGNNKVKQKSPTIWPGFSYLNFLLDL